MGWRADTPISLTRRSSPQSASRGGSAQLNAARRAVELRELGDGATVDVLVVGGGVTGVGVALDAATRGLRVALIERRDLASGTSRFSSKLVHGGLRYLTKGQLGVAWESARERALLLDHVAPHLVRPLPMLLPLIDDMSPARGATMELGIRIGDGLRVLAGTNRRRLPPTRRVTAQEAGRWVPGLRAAGLRGALLHWDGQLEDDARLVIALARTAAAHGARVLTYVSAIELRGDGALARDELTGEALEIRARHVVNATGVWAGTLAPEVALRPSKGSHLLVRASCLGDPRAAISTRIPDTFGRFVFAVPRPDGLVLIGLTDEPFDGAIPEVPQVTAEDEEFLLTTISRALERPLGADDVVGRFAGLRPLLDSGDGSTAELSRRHAVFEDARGVLTIVGGKLTTYRAMAQDVLDRIAARPGVRAERCVTRRLPLVGAQPPGARQPGVPTRLVRRFGAEAAAVAGLAEGQPELLKPIAPGVPVLGVELRFAVEHELALTVEDVLDRRTGMGLVPGWRQPTLGAADRIVGELAAVGA